MGLKDMLARMKLIEVEGAAAPSKAAALPSKGETPAAPRRSAPVDLKAILASVNKPPAAVPLPAAPPGPAAPSLTSGDLEADFDVVYRLAGVTAPAHGFTAPKILEILASEHLASLAPAAKAGALLGFLQAHPNGPVPIRDVIEDAIRRDAALDACEAALAARIKARAEDIERTMTQLQSEIDALIRRNRDLMDQGLAELGEQRRSMGQWQMRKRQEEARLFEAVSPFVEANPVSLGDVDSVPPVGDAH